jgi:hypothetical protein|tara:strand:- start:447 stop:1139 length:693 start_codon:yes stop_codon:yes gene_type:complete
MSYDTHKNFFYEHFGRKLRMWQLQSGAAVDTLGGYKIKLPDDTYGNQLVYPDEDITDGVRVEYTSLDEPFVAEALETTTVVASGTGIEFIDGGGFADRITDTAGGLGDLAVDDKIRIIGSASNDGDYTITVDGGAGSISVATGSLTDEDPGESIIIYQIPKEVASPDETSHVNLNRMLSLAVVCYVMAQLAVDPKEQGYYMNLFWRKVGDSESNKRQVATIMVSSPYAIK